jgi:hypothetical protein
MRGSQDHAFSVDDVYTPSSVPSAQSVHTVGALDPVIKPAENSHGNGHASGTGSVNGADLIATFVYILMRDEDYASLAEIIHILRPTLHGEFCSLKMQAHESKFQFVTNENNAVNCKGYLI